LLISFRKAGLWQAFSLIPLFYGQEGRAQDEFDVAMSKGHAVAIIEVRLNVPWADLENLLYIKLPNFRALYAI
jgi:hypothetical protein